MSTLIKHNVKSHITPIMLVYVIHYSGYIKVTLNGNRSLMIKPICNLYGKQFSPKRMMAEFAFDVIIDQITEPGQIGNFGRYKGVKTPYGACAINTPDYISNSERIEWMTNFLSRQIDNFRKYGATDIVFHIEWRGLQGNMEFTPLELNNLAALKIPLTITYGYEKQ